MYVYDLGTFIHKSILYDFLIEINFILLLEQLILKKN